MRAVWIVGLALLATACGKDKPSPAEQARQDAADVAAVNAAQVPPATPVTPETVGMPDIEKYDMYAFTAAHKTLPLPSYARVTNLDNGKSVVVRINDRGPFHENRVIDLSYAAAVKIGVWPKGTGLVEVRAIDPAHPDSRLPPTTVTAAPAPAGHRR